MQFHAISTVAARTRQMQRCRIDRQIFAWFHSQRLPHLTTVIASDDGELLFNGKTLVLYFLGTPTDDLGVLASELGQGREFNVLFNSVLEVAAPVASCGCSGGGCGAKP